MIQTILLNAGDDTGEVAKEMRESFLRSTLAEMGIPLDFWEEDSGILNVQQKIQLRKLLSDYEVQVVEDNDGAMEVYVGDDLIAEWFKPTFKLKKDLKERDVKKQAYIEMTVIFNSVFVENNSSDDNVSENEGNE